VAILRLQRPAPRQSEGPPDSPRARARRGWLVAVFALGLATRLAFLVVQINTGFFLQGQGPGDARLYLHLADSVIAGRGLSIGDDFRRGAPSGYPFQSGPTAWCMPGYPLFLAGCRLLFGNHQLPVDLLQCVLGALVCVTVAKMAARLFGGRAGLVAGIVAAIYPELVFSSVGSYAEPLYTFLLACALSVTLAVARDTGMGTARAASAGLLFGLAALVRPEALGLAVVLASVLGLVRALDARPAAGLRAGAVLAGTCLLVLLPWGLRNQIVMGRFLLLSSESGYVMWLGNNPGYDEVAFDFTRFGGYALSPVFKRLPQAAGLPEMEVDRVYREAAWSHIAAHPAKWVLRAPHKLWNMWRPVESTASWRHRAVAIVLYPPLMAASLLGMLLAWRMRGAWPLHACILATVALHAMSVGVLRFRLPLWPALIVFAGFAVDRAASRLQSRLAGQRASTAPMPSRSDSATLGHRQPAGSIAPPHMPAWKVFVRPVWGCKWRL
jgi:4-amino-4-deoxy-L-arabinose transferase-like glycosyltransferase